MGALQESFAFHYFHFLISGRRGKKPILLLFQPTRRNARKTPAFPSEALSPLVMKPHHHLNCSILKVCENGIKLIFPISLLFVISVASLLQRCISWEQESKSSWKLEALLYGLGTKKWKCSRGVPNHFLSFIYSGIYVFVFTLGLLKKIWFTDFKINLTSELNHCWAENLITTGMERALEVTWLSYNTVC